MGNRAPRLDDELARAIILEDDFCHFCHLIKKIEPNNSLNLSSDFPDRDSNPKVLHLLSRYSRLAMLDTFQKLCSHLDWNVTDDFGETPITLAARSRNQALVTILLTHGADPNYRNALDGNDSVLHISAHEGDLSTCRALLDAKADINAANLERMTPLIYAVQQRHLEVCQLLIYLGADTSCVDRRGYTCLDYAKMTEDEEILQTVGEEQPSFDQHRKREEIADWIKRGKEEHHGVSTVSESIEITCTEREMMTSTSENVSRIGRFAAVLDCFGR